MEEHLKILRKLGIALVIFGLLDIGMMIYCIKNEINYSSSFNIFAVIAGIFLLRGGLKTAGYVAFFSAFMLTAFAGLLVIFPFMEPLALRLITLQLYPIFTVSTYLLMPILIGFVYWIYRTSTSEPVLVAREVAGLSDKKPKLAFILGGLLVAVLSPIMYSLNYGKNAEIAKSKAAELYGQEYSYHVTSMSFSGGHSFVRLKAYKEGEIKVVKVSWDGSGK